MPTGRAKVVPENSGGGSDPAHINAPFLTAAAGDVTCRLRTAPLRVVPNCSRCAGVVLAASSGNGFTPVMLPVWLTESLIARWPWPLVGRLTGLRVRVTADAAAQFAARLRQDWQLYALQALWFAVFLYKPMLGLRIAFKDYSLFLYLVVVDHVALGEAAPISWLLHAQGRLTSSGSTFRLTGARAGLTGQFVYSSAGAPEVRVIEGFPGVTPSEIQGLALHRHVSAETPPDKRHSLVTLLVPYALDAPSRVLHFIDDQGHGVHVYFVSEDGTEYKIDLGM